MKAEDIKYITDTIQTIKVDAEHTVRTAVALQHYIATHVEEEAA